MVVLGHALDRAPRAVSFGRPVTIADAIRRQRVPLKLPTIAVIVPPAGSTREPAPVLRADWATRKVRRGETLMLVTVPRGEKGGSILGLVAALALAVVAPLAGGAIAGALFGGSAIAASLITAGISLAGGLLINAFFGPKPAGPAAVAETVYLAAASANAASPLGTIPCLYGEERFPPPLAAQPYSEFENNDQLLYQLHCVSVGHAGVSKLEIGKTAAWTSAGGVSESFPGLEMAVIPPGDPISLFPANVTVAPEVSGQTLPAPPAVLGPFTVNASGTEISAIALDFVFPAGLGTATAGGGVSAASRHLLAEYRAIDDEGEPAGAWTELFDETISRATRTPQRFTRRLDVTAGRYEVRFSALDVDLTEAGATANRVDWAGLRGVLADWTVPPNVTLIATKIRANEQLSQASASQYFVTAKRKLPIWNGETETWSAPAETASIAWAAADILRNGDYGAGLADAAYDLAWLAAYDAVWTERGDRFDGIFDRARPVGEALDAVLRAGRSYHVKLGGVIGFVRDEPKQVRRHVFGPGNTLRGSHSRKDIWFDEGATDSVRVRYRDAEVRGERTVLAAIGAIGSDVPQEKALFGLTGRDHVWREGIYDAACNAYRRSFRSFQVEREGQLLTRGDPVLYHDPLMEGVDAAQLVQRAGDDLTIDRDFAPEVGETYHLVVRDRRGREWGPVLVDGFAGRVVTLDAGDRALVEAQHGELDDVLPGEGMERARLSILAGDWRPFDGLIVSARPAGRYWEVLLVNDDQRVHLADETEIIPAPYTPPSLYAPPPEAPEIAGLYARASNGTVHIELEAGWQPAAGAQRYVAEISYDDGAAAAPDSASWTPVHDGVGTRFTAVILPEPFVLRVAAIGVRQGPWTYRTVASVPAPQLPPAIVTRETLDAVMGAAVRQLFAGEAAALGARLAALDDRIEQMAQANGGAWSAADEQLNSVVRSIGQRSETGEASIVTLQQATADLASALAQYFVGLRAVNPNGVAEAQFQMAAGALPEGAVAAVEFLLRAGVGGALATAAMRMVAFYSPALSAYETLIEFQARNVNLIDEDGNSRRLMAAVIASAPNAAPIVFGSPNTVRSDLRNGVPVSYTLMTAAAQLQFPQGARVGFPFWHIFKQDGTGGNALTADHSAIKSPLPEISTVANVSTILMGLVENLSPPTATYAAFGEPGQLITESVTIFAVSPPIEGKSVWNTAIDGPCTFPPGTYIFIPLGEDFQGTIELIAGGGASGVAMTGGGAPAEDGGDGGDTTFALGETFELIAGGGEGSEGRNNNSLPNFLLVSLPGDGGVASGGDTNTNGNGGGAVQTGGTVTSTRGGFGAAAPSGGAEAQTQFLAGGTSLRDGVPGNAPGGGAGGGAANTLVSGNNYIAATGGAGSGARVVKTFGAGVLLQNVAYELIVGEGGTTPTQTGGGPGSTIAQGAPGGNGRAVIS